MKSLSLRKSENWLKFALYSLLLTGMYYSTFTWLVMRDWTRDDFSFGYFIPVVVLYLIWEKRGLLASRASVPTWSGMVPVGLGLLLFWLGELSGEFFTLYISFWLVVVGVCLMHMGREKVRIIAFPLAFILAMFPLPYFLFNKITLQLKLVSSMLGVALIQLYGMSAFREGNIIDVGFTQLQVVDACSGLRYLIPLIVMGILLAYFYRAAWWKRLLLVCSTVPLSIVTNSIRIASVGILYQFFGPQVAEGFFHDFSGWVIFMVSLGLLLLEMWLLKRVFPERPTQGGEVGPPTPVSPPAKDACGNSWHRLLTPPQFVVTLAILLITVALSQGIEFREKTPIKKPFALFPLQVGEWVGVRQGMEQMYVDELGLSDYVMVDYKNPQGKGINFYTAYTESQRKGKATHTPATCLPGSGWNFTNSGTAAVTLANGETMPVSRAVMEKNGAIQLSYFWFPQRGRVLTSLYELKFYAFWDALTKQRTDGALVRLITPLAAGERVQEAENRLQDFTRRIVPLLNGFLPGKELR